jgi:hypothetical protein
MEVKDFATIEADFIQRVHGNSYKRRHIEHSHLERRS